VPSPTICRSAPAKSKAQQRLKRPGAWWRVDHADYILALRINRRNGVLETYWASLQRRHASKPEPTHRSLKSAA
jgi:hypothetical protein